MSRDYDLQYRLTDLTAGGIQDFSFTLDAAGNIDAITNALNTSLNQAFTQDDLHRIDYETGNYGTKDYAYDAVGNRLTKIHDSGGIMTQTLTYVSNSNRLATHNGNAVTLDAAGNTIGDPAENLSFTYGDHNRIREAYVGGVLQATYVYNGRGQRVKKIEAAGAQRTFVFHYGLNGEQIGETVLDSLGEKIDEREYIWLDSMPLAQAERRFSGSTVTSDAFVYLHADQLNTPRLATGESGTVVWRWDSDAFGLGEADTDPDLDAAHVNVPLRLPGQYFDNETGLHYNYFRDYDPHTGRYVQPDPISLEGGLNPYLYVEGNPLAFIDPLGLASRSGVRRAWNSEHGPRRPGVGTVAGLGFGYWREFLVPARTLSTTTSTCSKRIGEEQINIFIARRTAKRRNVGREAKTCLASLAIPENGGMGISKAIQQRTVLPIKQRTSSVVIKEA